MPDSKPTAETPWYKSDLFKWAIGIALGFALSWLGGHGITPAPIPQPVVPSVNVFTVPAAPAVVTPTTTK